MQDYVNFLDDEAESIAEFKAKQQQAFTTRVDRWKRSLQLNLKNRFKKITMLITVI